MNACLQVMSTGINPKKVPTGFPAATRNGGKNKMLASSSDCSNCGDGFGDCDCKDDCDCKSDCACSDPG